MQWNIAPLLLRGWILLGLLTTEYEFKFIVRVNHKIVSFISNLFLFLNKFLTNILMDNWTFIRCNISVFYFTHWNFFKYLLQCWQICFSCLLTFLLMWQEKSNCHVSKIIFLLTWQCIFDDVTITFFLPYQHESQHKGVKQTYQHCKRTF
jgi:hypothetical protein